MNVLYKYCDQEGIEKILETLELKLPYISHVNDPLECLPFMYCPDDDAAIEEHCLSVLKRKRIIPPADCKQKLRNAGFCKKLEEDLREDLRAVNRKSCLLSVSKTAQNLVMWAHYADKHKGVVVGIDFDNVSPDANGQLGILMDSVSYSKDRPKINVLEWLEEGVQREAILKAVMTKSDSWGYEKEFRAMFPVNTLEIMKKQGLSNFRKINLDDTKESWLLKLNPASIKEVVFGLYTEKKLKEDIKELIKRPDLKHINLLQAEEAETYTLNLKNIT